MTSSSVVRVSPDLASPARAVAMIPRKITSAAWYLSTWSARFVARDMKIALAVRGCPVEGQMLSVSYELAHS